jgi:arginine repressor
MSMKKWKILSESGIKNHESGIKELIKVLLNNRGIKTKKEIEEFLNSKLSNITINNLTIDSKQLNNLQILQLHELLVLPGNSGAST